MDCQAAAHRLDWRPQRNLHSVLEEIADHAEKNPNWLDLTSA
jgi:nucleoside-diphosphate-sugar epimerase